MFSGFLFNQNSIYLKWTLLNQQIAIVWDLIQSSIIFRWLNRIECIGRATPTPVISTPANQSGAFLPLHLTHESASETTRGTVNFVGRIPRYKSTRESALNQLKIHRWRRSIVRKKIRPWRQANGQPHWHRIESHFPWCDHDIIKYDDVMSGAFPPNKLWFMENELCWIDDGPSIGINICPRMLETELLRPLKVNWNAGRAVKWRLGLSGWRQLICILSLQPRMKLWLTKATRVTRQGNWKILGTSGEIGGDRGRSGLGNSFA